MVRDKLIFAIDFDGTIVTDDFPKMGKLRPNAKEVINAIFKAGHDVLVWTCRSWDEHTDANIFDVAKFLGVNQVMVHGINVNSDKLAFKPFPKIYADVYIDDRQLGGIPSDWLEILMLINKELKHRNMDEIKLNKQVDKEVIPVFDYVKVIAEEGYDWLPKGTRLYFDAEANVYIYDYEFNMVDEHTGASYEEDRTYVLSIDIANQGVLNSLLEYGGELVTDTEFIENGE